MGNPESNTFQLDLYHFAPGSEFDVGTDVALGNIGIFGDQPDLGCSGDRPVMHWYFEDYIRFKPAGSGDNIFVTIGLVKWHDTGETHLVPIPGTGDNDYYPLPPPIFVTADPSDTKFDSNDFDIFDFPFWKQILVHHDR